MTFDVTINDRPWRVALEATGQAGRVQVSVKGRRRLFDASWIDSETLSLIGLDGPSSQVREIGIRSTSDGQLDVLIAGTHFRATAIAEGKPDAGRAAIRQIQGVSSGSRSERVEGRQSVVASMPGRIVRVLVASGDRVTTGQPVVVVEAMKMENEMRAPKDGVVRDVNVQEGAAIEAGAVLVVID
jgi:biotin carboxyl carrier protein